VLLRSIVLFKEHCEGSRHPAVFGTFSVRAVFGRSQIRFQGGCPGGEGAGGVRLIAWWRGWGAESFGMGGLILPPGHGGAITVARGDPVSG
jgi:hypothetical protein